MVHDEQIIQDNQSNENICVSEDENELSCSVIIDMTYGVRDFIFISTILVLKTSRNKQNIIV